MHVVFVSPIAGKQSSVEECCGLAGIETASVEIINIKTDTESLVGIDGKVGFETLFTVTAIESFIIAQVGKGESVLVNMISSGRSTVRSYGSVKKN